ncbi:MAG: hypothetical protein OXG25_12475 [Gammaproteobacteria bacterium]|nr:hypothetical protein [Gammaproteobacteria bacterium]
MVDRFLPRITALRIAVITSRNATFAVNLRESVVMQIQCDVA